MQNLREIERENRKERESFDYVNILLYMNDEFTSIYRETRKDKEVNENIPN